MLSRSLLSPITVAIWTSSAALVACNESRPAQTATTAVARAQAPAMSNGATNAQAPAAATDAVPADPKPATNAPVDPMTTLDSDMKAVMDQLATLHGKPIVTLAADEARKSHRQPMR